MKPQRPFAPAAMLLGLGGAIPFVGLAALTAMGPVTWHAYWLTALSHYGAVILTFVGALHWGYALKRGAQGSSAWLQYGFSVVPALLAWLSLFFDVWTALRMQAVALLVCYVVDVVMKRVVPVPDGFLGLRAGLTVTGALSLIFASLA